MKLIKIVPQQDSYMSIMWEQNFQPHSFKPVQNGANLAKEHA